MITFQWNNTKNAANKTKHGIDFETAKTLWNDPFRIEIQTSCPDEDRNILIGKIGDKLWTAVFTIRGRSIRIISVRRSRKREKDLYEQKETGQKR